MSRKIPVQAYSKGDIALKEIGRSLQRISKIGVRTYRYGGDEFAIPFHQFRRN